MRVKPSSPPNGSELLVLNKDGKTLYVNRTQVAAILASTGVRSRPFRSLLTERTGTETYRAVQGGVLVEFTLAELTAYLAGTATPDPIPFGRQLDVYSGTERFVGRQGTGVFASDIMQTLYVRGLGGSLEGLGGNFPGGGGGTPTPTPTPTPSSTLIVMAIGQSNEAGTGRNANIDPTLDANNPAILQWEIGVAPPTAIANQFPAGLPWPAPSGGSSIRGPAPAVSYAKARLASFTNVVIIPAAVGETALYNDVWAAPSGTRYVAARDALAACLAAYPGAVVDILWTQGEEDVITKLTSEANYSAALATMVAGFRAVTGAASAPFLMHGMTPEFIAGNGSVALGIQAAHRKAPLTIANSFYVPGTAGTNFSGDNTHYSAAACRNSGTRRAGVRAAAIALSAAAPATPANPSLVNDTISWKVPTGNAVAYVVQTSAVGANSWGNDLLVFPAEYTAEGGTVSAVAPGSGARDIRVIARSRGGDSAPTATLSYTPGSYATESTAIFTAMQAAGSEPDTTRKGVIDTYVKALLMGSTSGTNILAKLDVLHTYAAHSSAAALINWANPAAYAATLSATPPTFTVDRGFTTDGAASEINSNFNPATAPSPKFTQNSALFAIGSRTSAASANSDGGWFNGTSGVTLACRATGDNLNVRLNQTSVSSFVGGATLGNGFFAGDRDDGTATGVVAYRNGVARARVTGTATVAPVSETLRVGRSSATGYAARQYTDNMIGGHLTTAEHTDLAAARAAYMTAVGA